MLETILTTIGGFLGGSGLVGFTWAIVAWYRRKREYDLANRKQDVEDHVIVVTQLRESLEYQRKLVMIAEERKIAVENQLTSVREEFYNMKGKLVEYAADNVRLKGELLQWQTKKGA